jgi:hypothetical protein
MLSFINKCNIEVKNIESILRYNRPIIECKVDFESAIHPKYYYRLKEIIQNCEYFGIYPKNVGVLPNNINNPNLTLAIWFNKYENNDFNLPENWNIKELVFYNFKYSPIIPNSFKTKKIRYEGFF